MKTNCLLLALSGLIAGCSSKYEPVYFVSEARVPASIADSDRSKSGLNKADDLAIQQSAYGWMLAQDVTALGKFSAVYLEADDEVVLAMIKQFPVHLPPIKTGDRLDLRSNRNPLDKDTGGAALILGAETVESSRSGSVTANCRWYVGGELKKSAVLTMEKTGATWDIVGAK